MNINLNNVNISLAEFQRMSKGDYNAGEVRLAGENKLEKVNNHVRLRFLNNKTIDHAEVIAIKNAFVNALETNGLSAERLDEIRQKLGLASSGVNWTDMSKLSMKPLTRQQIREIIDANAKDIHDMAVETSSTIYAGGRMSSGNVAKREKVNQALAAPTRSLDQNVEISAFQIVATGQIDYVEAEDKEMLLDAAKNMLGALMEGCGDKPRADVKATATLKLQSGLTLKLPTVFSELEFAHKLEEDIMRMSMDGFESMYITDAEEADKYGRLDTPKAREQYFAGLAGDPDGGNKARVVAVKIMHDAGIIDYDTLSLPNHMEDAHAIALAKHLDSIRDLPRDAIRNDPTFKALTDASRIHEGVCSRQTTIPAMASNAFNQEVRAEFGSDPKKITLPSFRKLASEARDVVRRQLGVSALPEDESKPLVPSGTKALGKAMNCGNDIRITADDARDRYIAAALEEGAGRLVMRAISDTIPAETLKGISGDDVYSYVLSKNANLLDRIVGSGSPEAAAEIVASLKQDILDSVGYCKLSKELDKMSNGIVSNMKTALAKKLNADAKQVIDNVYLDWNKLEAQARDLKSSIKSDILSGKAKTLEECRQAFDKLAEDFVEKATGSLGKVYNLDLPPKFVPRFKFWLMRCKFSATADFGKMRELAKNIDFGAIGKALENLKSKGAAGNAQDARKAGGLPEDKLAVIKAISNTMESIRKEIFLAAGIPEKAIAKLGTSEEYEPMVMFLVLLAQEHPAEVGQIMDFLKNDDVLKVLQEQGQSNQDYRKATYFLPISNDPKVDPYFVDEAPQINALFPDGKLPE